MKITNIKQIVEINDFEETNKKLREGWVLLEIYKKDKCSLNYVLGNTEFESTKIKISTGIYINSLDKTEEAIVRGARFKERNNLGVTMVKISEGIGEEYGQ